MIEGVSVATMKETQRLAPTRKTPQHKRITYEQGEGNNVMEIKKIFCFCFIMALLLTADLFHNLQYRRHQLHTTLKCIVRMMLVISAR